MARPGFALLAIVTLALGIGASTAMWSVVDGVLLRSLPYPAGDSLVSLYRYNVKDPNLESPRPQPMAKPGYWDIKDQTKSLASTFGFMQTRLTVTGRGDAAALRGALVTEGPLETFGLLPALGRDVRQDEATEGAASVALIGWQLFQDRFGGQSSAIGEVVTVDGVPHTVVGVAPEGFDFPGGSQLWTNHQWPLDDCGRDCHFMRSVGRLAPGNSIADVNEELAVVAQRLASEYPTSRDKRYRVDDLRSYITRNVQTSMYVLLGAVALVLLIACANVANLLLVRGERRGRELAIRTAIGATRGRLLRQLVFENALLAAAGVVVGLGFGWLALEGLLGLAPSGLPRLDGVHLDARVVLFAAASGLATLLLFGLLPAWRQSAASFAGKLRTRGGDAGLQRSALLTVEVALSLMLLLGAGLLVRTLGELLQVDPGFETTNLTSFNIDLPDQYDTEFERTITWFQTLEERLASHPGVISVGSALSRPFGGLSLGGSGYRADRPRPAEKDEGGTKVNAVTRTYFATLGVPLVAGRNFGPQDRLDSPPVAIVNQAFVDAFYPGESPLEKPFAVGMSLNREYDEPYTIVGVVADHRTNSLTATALPEFFMLQDQVSSDYLAVTVRSQPGVDVASLAQKEVKALNPDVPVQGMRTIEEALIEQTGSARFYLTILTSFALLAVLLAGIGLYGVVAYLVAQRTRELALRMALGADQKNIVRHVVLRGLKPALLGIVIGLLGALAASRVLESLLYGISARDPLTFGVAAALLLAIALLACAIPAQRASSISPMVALKSD